MIKVLQGMNCFIDGEEFIGTATKAGIVFPQPKVKEVASPGYAGLRKMQTGKMEIEDIKITLQDYPAKVIAMVGHPDSVDKELQLIGVIGPKDPRTITITVSGPWNSLEGDEWADDSDGALNFGVFPEEYKLEIDNKEVVYYDVEANEVRLDGKSITKDLNKRLKRSKGLVSS